MALGFFLGIVGFGLQVLAIFSVLFTLGHAGQVDLGPYLMKDAALWIFGAYLRYYSRHSVKSRR